MRTTVYKINDTAQDIEIIKQAAECIGRGGLVAFPTETVYGIACKVVPGSLAKLDEIKKRNTDKRYTLHIGDKNKLSDYVPYLTLPARKLVANAWPGPVTIVFEIKSKDISQLKTKFGDEIIKILYKDNTIGIRCPENALARQLLNLCPFPVVAPSANTAGKEPATSAQQAIKQFDGIVDIILDGGKCKYEKSSTVVRISAGGWRVLREGIFSQQQIRKMLTVHILFVCTGNTCRSPMAEGFAKNLLTERLKCSLDPAPSFDSKSPEKSGRCGLDQLENIGYKVSSAGVAAMDGIGASSESIKFCNSKSIHIAGHLSRKLTSEMASQADYIFVMSAGHRDDVIRLFPAAAGKCMLLNDAGDIKDPIGRGFEVYKEVGEIIEKAVNKRMNEILK